MKARLPERFCRNWDDIFIIDDYYRFRAFILIFSTPI
jgi:hypothetical protein